MRKLFGFFIAAGLVLLVTAAWAGLPSTINTGSSTVNKVVNTGLDAAKNKAIEDDINNKIKTFNCAFKNNTTTTETTCDLNKVFQTISSKKAPFEALGLASVYVYIKAGGTSSTAYDRARYVEDTGEATLGTSWWKVSSSAVRDNTNNLSIYVEAK